LHVSWNNGGQADVEAVRADRITLSSTIPSAPGSRLLGLLASGSALKVKVASCRKQDRSFTIEGRLIDTTRAVRVEIEALLGQPPD
jgi:hypothetical protein